MRNKLLTLLLILSLLGVPTAASAQGGDAAAATPQLFFQLVASGLNSPVAVTNAGDGSGRLFITQQSGEILIYNGTQLLSTPFLDISGKLLFGGERGLLSVAFHPNYQSNGYFYADYTRAGDGATVIARYSVSANPNIANTTETILKVIAQPYNNHNGGQLQFGPDGYLYIGMGDGGSSGDPENRAQNPTSLLGKILRIDVDGGAPYAIPPDNPFVNNPNVADEIWAFGVRNPWRFSFDRQTGDLFIADVGQNAWEEIDFQAASSAGGRNYGWSCFEGLHNYDTSRTCTTYGALTSPILEYAHGAGDSIGCSVTGGYRYRGSQFPALVGTYLYADYCTGTVWGGSFNGTSWTSSQLADTSYNVSAFGEDEAGELYLVDLNGAVYHISGSTFSDVAPTHWAWAWIETLYADGITGGCLTNPLKYCPAGSVTRAQMAVFLLRAKHGGTYTPPAASGIFDDVPANYWAADWIEQLYAEGVTGGCSTAPLLYCPNQVVNRAEMAVFLLGAKYGSTYVPPAASGIFADIPSGFWAEDWIEQLYAEGVTGGCIASPLQYCPTDPVNRAQMAVFLVRNFDLPLVVP
jgi:glucose/arabinose dehydrogenase